MFTVRFSLIALKWEIKEQIKKLPVTDSVIF
jgi:hypothetical protein